MKISITTALAYTFVLHTGFFGQHLLYAQDYNLTLFRLNTKDSALEALLRTAAEPQTTVKPAFVAPVAVKVRIQRNAL